MRVRDERARCAHVSERDSAARRHMQHADARYAIARRLMARVYALSLIMFTI